MTHYKSKQFFFAKKDQKTFVSPHLRRAGVSGEIRNLKMRGSKSFLLFFSKKKALLVFCNGDGPFSSRTSFLVLLVRLVVNFLA